MAAGPGVLALLLCLGSALGIALLWLSGVERLASALRRSAEETALFAAPLRVPRLPALPEVQDGVARLVRSLQARAARLGELKAADEAILEALPEPLLVLDGDLEVRRANRAARKLFGIAPGADRPGDMPVLLRHPLMAAALDLARGGGGPQQVDVTLPGPSPRELSAQILPMTQIQDAPADAGRIVMLVTDRTAARTVERMRADFVTNASHELRTPLASLMGFIETLRGPAADDHAARERFLGIMADQAERMHRLINDLLSLSRIETTEHMPPEGEADLAALLRAEAAAAEPLLEKRGIRLVLDLPEAPLRARPASADQLAQVARNLLDNAIRHARAEVRLEAAASEHRGRPGVAFAVTDDGPGVPAEHIPRLTERFYRVDRGRARAVGNTGLGLAIVKHIVNRHRGHLLIESREGEWARFRAWWPADAD